MGGSVCRKILLNSGGVIGTLGGISNVFVADTDNSIPQELIEEGEKLICGFHKDLLAYEAKILKASGYKPDDGCEE